MPPRRRGGAGSPSLVLDEALPRAVALELRGRGRRAESVYELGLVGLTDAELLAALLERKVAGVLVTADLELSRHASAAWAGGLLAMAGLDPPGTTAATPEAWRRETVARWAHVIERQPAGTLVRYGPAGYRPWVRRPG